MVNLVNDKQGFGAGVNIFPGKMFLQSLMFSMKFWTWDEKTGSSEEQTFSLVNNGTSVHDGCPQGVAALMMMRTAVFEGVTHCSSVSIIHTPPPFFAARHALRCRLRVLSEILQRHGSIWCDLYDSHLPFCFTNTSETEYFGFLHY